MLRISEMSCSSYCYWICRFIIFSPGTWLSFNQIYEDDVGDALKLKIVVSEKEIINWVTRAAATNRNMFLHSSAVSCGASQLTIAGTISMVKLNPRRRHPVTKWLKSSYHFLHKMKPAATLKMCVHSPLIAVCWFTRLLYIADLAKTTNFHHHQYVSI